MFRKISTAKLSEKDYSTLKTMMAFDNAALDSHCNHLAIISLLVCAFGVASFIYNDFEDKQNNIKHTFLYGMGANAWNKLTTPEPVSNEISSTFFLG